MKSCGKCPACLKLAACRPDFEESITEKGIERWTRLVKANPCVNRAKIGDTVMTRGHGLGVVINDEGAGKIQTLDGIKAYEYDKIVTRRRQHTCFNDTKLGVDKYGALTLAGVSRLNGNIPFHGPSLVIELVHRDAEINRLLRASQDEDLTLWVDDLDKRQAAYAEAALIRYRDEACKKKIKDLNLADVNRWLDIWRDVS